MKSILDLKNQFAANQKIGAIHFVSLSGPSTLDTISNVINRNFSGESKNILEGKSDKLTSSALIAP